LLATLQQNFHFWKELPNGLQSAGNGCTLRRVGCRGFLCRFCLFVNELHITAGLKKLLFFCLNTGGEAAVFNACCFFWRWAWKPNAPARHGRRAGWDKLFFGFKPCFN